MLKDVGIVVPKKDKWMHYSAEPSAPWIHAIVDRPSNGNSQNATYAVQTAYNVVKL